MAFGSYDESEQTEQSTQESDAVESYAPSDRDRRENGEESTELGADLEELL